MRKIWEICAHRCVIHISGWEVERFLNICKHNEVSFSDIITDKTGIFATITYKQWKRVCELKEKCQVQCNIVTEMGMVPFLLKYKKRIAFLISLCLCFGIVFYSSLFIWHIDVEGTAVYTEEEIVEYISHNLVPIGTKRNDVSIAQLEKDLRMQYDQMAWITCETDGTRLIVRIVETIDKEEIKSFDTPCNIVAIKDGVVLDLLAKSGKKVAAPGDEVKKGDILITGVVNVYNEYEELIETNYVAADGLVYGQTEYEYLQSFSMDFIEKKQGKKKKTGYGIQLGTKVKTLYEPYDTEGYEQVASTHTFHIGNAYYLPLSFIITKYYMPEYKTNTYTEQEAKEKQNRMLQKYIGDLKKKGVEILENNVTIEIKDGICTASGTLVVREIIGAPEVFTIPESTIQKNEE